MDRALIVVEGARVEPSLFASLASCFGMSVQIFVYATNIYDLFKRLKQDSDAFGGERMLNIRDVLLERVKEDDVDGRNILSQDFAYTYLVYDCDVQHHEPNVRVTDVKQLLAHNLPVLAQMLAYFTDETDETLGKLYINYPMVEAWRDADDFFDESYREREVSLFNIKTYKRLVSSRRLTGFGYELSEEQFSSILRMMIAKICHIVSKRWMLPNYETYRKCSDGLVLFEVERGLMISRQVVSVVNTSLCLIVDHLGRNFYNTLIKGGAHDSLT